MSDCKITAFIKIVGTCKDCKWWDRDSGHHSFGHRHCLHDKLNCDKPEETDNLVAEGFDGSNYFGPNFGCIHWEAKV